MRPTLPSSIVSRSSSLPSAFDRPPRFRLDGLGSVDR
jgi:hypothetical protein